MNSIYPFFELLGPMDSYEPLSGPQREKTCLQEFVNNKGTNQPTQSDKRLFIRLLESIKFRLATSEILTILLVTVAEQDGLNLTFF